MKAFAQLKTEDEYAALRGKSADEVRRGSAENAVAVKEESGDGA
jgi:hypothetical protein